MFPTDAQRAEILIVLVSDDKAAVHRLKDDMRQSRYAYLLNCVADRRGILKAVENQIAGNKREKPIVLVVDYRMARAECKALITLSRQIADVTAIECLVMNVPADEKIQRELRLMGAIVQEAQIAGERRPFESALLTLH